MAQDGEPGTAIGAQIRRLRSASPEKERYRLNVYRTKVNAGDLKMMILTGVALGAVFIAGLQSWFDWSKAADAVPVLSAPGMSPAEDPYFEARADRTILDRQAGPPPPHRNAAPTEPEPAPTR